MHSTLVAGGAGFRRRVGRLALDAVFRAAFTMETMAGVGDTPGDSDLHGAGARGRPVVEIAGGHERFFPARPF